MSFQDDHSVHSSTAAAQSTGAPPVEAASEKVDLAELGAGRHERGDISDFDFDVDKVVHDAQVNHADARRQRSSKAPLLDSLGNCRPTVLSVRHAEQALNFLACFESREEFDNALRSYHLTLKTSSGFVNYNGTSSHTCVCVVCCHESRKLGGARAANFMNNLVRDLVSSECGCGFICQAQRISRRHYHLRQWRTTPLARNCPSYINGSPSTKKAAQEQVKNANFSPLGFGADDLVWVVTLFNPHSGTNCVRGALNLKPLDDESAVLSGDATSTTHPSSAAALAAREDNRFRARRGPTGEQLANAVREKFSSLGVDPLNLSTEDLKSHLDTEYNSASCHRLVRRNLRETATKYSSSSSLTEILHVLVEIAKKELGHYAKVHYATADELNAWQVEAAKARFKKLWKQSHPGIRCPAFDPKKAGMVPFLDVHPVTCEKILYVKGWSLIPSYMIDGIKHFSGVTAADAAFGKSRNFPSTFYLEGTLDANSHVHPVSITHCLGNAK